MAKKLKITESQYRDKKFDLKESFEKWLKETAKYKITFEDDQQDFLEWYLDERGEVIDCKPFQASVWNGTMVDIAKIKIGAYLPLLDDNCIIHNVKTLETLN